MSARQPDIVIVIPVFNDDAALRCLLDQLDELIREYREARDSPLIKTVVVDGAARSSTASLTAGRAVYLASEPGRGAQIAAGVHALEAPWVWVLHADTQISAQVLEYMAQVVRCAAPVWGRFDVQLEGLSMLAWFMNWRSRLSRICTGDQAMFFAAELLSSIGGFPALPLMEDIEVSKRLRRSGAFRAPHIAVRASTRRWRQQGVLRTVVFMWWTRLRYFFGVSAAALYADYYGRVR